MNVKNMLADSEIALQLSREYNFTTTELRTLHNITEIAYLTGDRDSARRYAPRNAALCDRLSGATVLPVLDELLLYARVLVLDGAIEQARNVWSEIGERLKIANEAAEARGETRLDFHASNQVLFDMVDLATRAASTEEWDALMERSARDSVQEETIEVWAIRGLSAERAGDVMGARRALGKAVELAEDIPSMMGEQVRNWFEKVAA
jgi:hypothetical protein